MILNSQLKEDLNRFSQNQSIGVMIQPKYEELLKHINFVDMYVGTYLDLIKDYGQYYVRGKGYKTNPPNSAQMNYGYNYINNEKFTRIGHARGGEKYTFYQSFWRETCDIMTERLKQIPEINKYVYSKYFDLVVKFDHRSSDRLDNDFDGIIKVGDNEDWWWKNNQQECFYHS